jgi:hypothetical protein
VLRPHPAGALEQAHAMQGAPKHLGRGSVAGIAEHRGERVEAGAQFGLRVVVCEARVDRQLEHRLVE